uniref:Uncharacterized protein n=1 Tax=Rhodothermus marinus TaxID=29549 RepID=A0A7V2F6U7_RHOMR
MYVEAIERLVREGARRMRLYAMPTASGVCAVMACDDRGVLLVAAMPTADVARLASSIPVYVWTRAGYRLLSVTSLSVKP